MWCIYLLNSMYEISWFLYLRITEIEVTNLRQVVLIELNNVDRSDNLRQVELIVLNSVTRIEQCFSFSSSVWQKSIDILRSLIFFALIIRWNLSFFEYVSRILFINYFDDKKVLLSSKNFYLISLKMIFSRRSSFSIKT